MHFFKHIKIIINLLTFDKNEKKFIQKKRTIKINKNKKYILIQLVDDYYYLVYYKCLIEKYFSNYEIVGLWPYMYLPVRRSNSLTEILKNEYNNYLLKLKLNKWRILYGTLGIKKFVTLSNTNFSKFNAKPKNKEQLLRLKIFGIKVGDLIYDTYIRYRASETVNLKDKYLNLYVNFAYQSLRKIEALQKKYNFKYFFTSYASYVHHGIPVRFFTSKTKVTVISGRNAIQYNQKLSKDHFYHTFSYKKFKLIKKSVKKIPFKKVEDFLIKKYSGLSNTNNFPAYMVTNPYNKIKNGSNQLNNIDGVLFTQSIYDSPHAWGGMLYNDYYEWICDTLNYIKKNNLKIAIKPHPNSIKKQIDVKKLHVSLKAEYSELTWLDENLSNNEIFKKIKFGISATGTVLFELAWHKILAISCGQSPYSYNKFSLNAESKEKYYFYLKNAHKIKYSKIPKKKLLEFYYFYNFYDHNVLKIHKIKKIFNQNANFNSKILNNF